MILLSVAVRLVVVAGLILGGLRRGLEFHGRVLGLVAFGGIRRSSGGVGNCKQILLSTSTSNALQVRLTLVRRRGSGGGLLRLLLRLLVVVRVKNGVDVHIQRI